MSTYSIDLGKLPLDKSIRVRQGDDHRDYYTLQGNSTALDLTDATWTLTVSTKRGGTALLSKTSTTSWTTSGVKVDTAASGTFTVSVIGTDVTTCGVGTHYYEVGVVFPAGQATFPSLTKTIIAGEFRVDEDVS